MNDETTILQKPKTSTQETVSTETKTTTETTGAPKPSETMINGASGRFWIVLLLGFGAVFIPILYLVAVICGRTVDATVFLSIYGAYLGPASIGIGVYLGAQSQKPKA